MKLPVIDIKPFLEASDPSARLSVAQSIDAACRTFGAFYLKGHGIDTDAVQQEMRRYFSLPVQEKQKCAVEKGGFLRGYIGMGDESGSDALEVKEAYSYGYPWKNERTPENSMQGPNVWPALEGWQQQMETFFSDMIRISEALTRAFSLSYGKPEDYLGGYCQSGDTISVMRLFHYFPYSAADERFPHQHDRIGSSAHTDWGFLTLILQQDHVTGLQLWHEEEWNDVVPEPGTLLVNGGDYFSLLTDGEYRSPLHRVVSQGGERLSAVLFYYPSFDARIPVMAQQDYSLFKNQVHSGGEIEKNSVSEKPFGQYIREKWEQVSR